jgi:hypothetical protein
MAPFLCILNSEATARLPDDSYEVEALGELRVKGKSANISIYAVKQKKIDIEKKLPRYYRRRGSCLTYYLWKSLFFPHGFTEHSPTLKVRIASCIDKTSVAIC